MNSNKPAIIPSVLFLVALILLGLTAPVTLAQRETYSTHMNTHNDDHQTLAGLALRFGQAPVQKMILIDVSAQRLSLYQGQQLVHQWPVSTAENGVGNQLHSLRTPLGTHRIAKKIGAGAAPGTIFKGREDTGKIATIYTDTTRAKEDYVTTRILWLEGLEPGINQGPGIDSYQRYIYIHGTPEEGRIGSPASHGCIRMRNADVTALYDLLEPGTLVHIQE